MPEPEKTDEAFVIAIKLATMRNCMLQTDEKEALMLITGNVLTMFSKIMAGKNIQTLEDDLKSLFDSINRLITSKKDRILEFIENLQKLDQDVKEDRQIIHSITQRWAESNQKLQKFELNKFRNESYEKRKIKVDEFQQEMLLDFKVYCELLEFENKMQARSKDIINIIIKSNPKIGIDGLAEILLNYNP